MEIALFMIQNARRDVQTSRAVIYDLRPEPTWLTLSATGIDVIFRFHRTTFIMLKFQA